jgi:heme/copper-type cytochrome/quinol oxidase subunit 3
MAVAVSPRSAPPAPATAAAHGQVLPTPDVVAGPSTLTLATGLAGAAITMLIGCLLGAYLLFRHDAGTWPPKGVSPDFYLGNMILLTALMAAASAQWAVYASRHDDRRNTLIATALGAILALAAANAVWYGLQHPGFGVGESTYTTLYYCILGSYLVAVVGGLVLTVFTALRGVGGHYTKQAHAPVTANALYWHVLTALWVAIWAVVWVVK